jgi:hypothetical protein
MILTAFLCSYITGAFCVGVMNFFVAKGRASFWMLLGSFFLWPIVLATAIIVMVEKDEV